MSFLTGQAQVSLHPVASRHGTASSTLVPVNSPSSNPRQYQQSRDELADRDDGQGTPRLQRSSPDHPWSHPVQQRSPSPKSLPQPTQSLEFEASTHGIHHADLEDYPVIYDEALPSDSTGDDDDDQDDDDDTLDDAPYHSSRTADSTQRARKPRFHKRKLAAPVRAMSAAQLAQLHEQYVAQDVPHNIVFPFLHGVDGSIPAQNYFFGAPLSGQPAPAYRGLTIVRADMPSRQEVEQLCASHDACSSGRSRARTFSSVTTQSSDSSPDTDDESSRFEPSWIDGSHTSPPFGFAASTAAAAADPAAFMTGSSASATPSTASTVSSQASRPSLFSSESYGSGSRTSVSTASDVGDEGSRAAKHLASSSLSDDFEKQPRQFILNSTVYPAEIIKPPSIRRTMYGRNFYDDLSDGSFGDEGDADQVRRIGPSFINPPQASGVSLRNFKIQCAKYATISDIVIYCPFGYHSGVLTLAKWVREAQASLRKERLSRGWGGLQYNVFVVTEPFPVFEERFPSLISIDSNGFDRNRVDFVDREREEMERMTQATEIHDNVWLGCTADAPGVPKRETWQDRNGQDSAPITPDEQANPRCFSVCINCEEDHVLPSSTCSPETLRNAAKYLDSVDASARIDSDTDKILDSLHRDHLFHLDGSPGCEYTYDGFRSSNSRDGSIVLGPNGWIPKPRSVPANADPPASQFAPSCFASPKDVNGRGLLRLDANSVVQLDCQVGSGGATCTNGWQDKMAKKLVDVCAWIQQQASPPAPVQPDRDAPIFSTISSTLRTFRDGVRSPTRSFSPNHGRDRTSHVRSEQRSNTARRPRRVLLHCPDGYTETSVLALSYLMYARELTLPEAYLDLQLRANRSFFVYPADVGLLQAVERHLRNTRAARRQSMPEPMDMGLDTRRSRHATSKSFSGALTLDGPHMDSRRMSLSAGPGEDGSKYSIPGGFSSDEMASGICRSSTPTPTKCRAHVVAVDASELVESHDWFDKSKFDGSFPSRILPFLYLGNLDHASNVDMLRVLGITHLVSVGETALEPPAHISAKVNPPRKEHGRSRYQRASAKAALAEDPLTVPSCTYQSQGVTVLNVRNVSDDGIDSLRGTMREAVQFIEAARLAGGKVLVHCRVGVSRSTTIVLAYVMAHLDLGLVESYLLVRSRRLNIVIQPHLLFLPTGIPYSASRLTWGHLAREIAELNSRYFV
uniref:Protein tyrosine phosphatase n=1 Tax=Kalmanozyma brasiliensis (strain GHG001) TaxID=1365824 RepID=V5EMP3_KALBG